MQNNLTEPTPTQLYHTGGRKEGDAMLLKGGFYNLRGSLLKLAKYSWSISGFKIYCTDLITPNGEYRFNHGLIVKSLDELVPCSVNEQQIIENIDTAEFAEGYRKWVNYCDERDSRGKIRKVMSKSSIEGMMALAEDKEKKINETKKYNNDDIKIPNKEDVYKSFEAFRKSRGLHNM